MNANQLHNVLTFAEVNGKLQPDTRRMMQNERIALQAAIDSRNPQKIKAAMEEALRVADMWGVGL